MRGQGMRYVSGGEKMFEIGKTQILKVIRKKTFGVYLAEDEGQDAVLLPAKGVPEGCDIGSEIEVFIYRDSSDRLIATTAKPLITMEEMAVLKVKETTKIGVFLDWGLEKDLFLPYKEQTEKLQAGDRCLVRLYVDKSGRLCASMKIYDYLKPCDCYKEGDLVEGTIYRVNPQIGAFTAVDNLYYGLIPNSELYDNYRFGDKVAARVTAVREDGKLNLALREKAYLQMEEDAKAILLALEDYGGVLPFGEKADPEVIKRELKMSKNAFKRALGRLLKERRIDISDSGTVRLL